MQGVIPLLLGPRLWSSGWSGAGRDHHVGDQSHVLGWGRAVLSPLVVGLWLCLEGQQEGPAPWLLWAWVGQWWAQRLLQAEWVPVPTGVGKGLLEHGSLLGAVAAVPMEGFGAHGRCCWWGWSLKQSDPLPTLVLPHRDMGPGSPGREGTHPPQWQNSSLTLNVRTQGCGWATLRPLTDGT